MSAGYEQWLRPIRYADYLLGLPDEEMVLLKLKYGDYMTVAEFGAEALKKTNEEESE